MAAFRNPTLSRCWHLLQRECPSHPRICRAASHCGSSPQPAVFDVRAWSFEFESFKGKQLIGSGSFGKVSGLPGRARLRMAGCQPGCQAAPCLHC